MLALGDYCITLLGRPHTGEAMQRGSGEHGLRLQEAERSLLAGPLTAATIAPQNASCKGGPREGARPREMMNWVLF